jgi:hypothetical protein
MSTPPIVSDHEGMRRVVREANGEWKSGAEILLVSEEQ